MEKNLLNDISLEKHTEKETQAPISKSGSIGRMKWKVQNHPVWRSNVTQRRWTSPLLISSWAINLEKFNIKVNKDKSIFIIKIYKCWQLLVQKFKGKQTKFFMSGQMPWISLMKLIEGGSVCH